MDRREEIQHLLVRIVATHPAGSGLCLIGGFRLRLLNQSSRRSVDVDYHWDGDLDEKQREIVALLRRQLLPEVRRRMGLDGSVSPAIGPDAEAASTRVIDAAFYRIGVPHSRIEIPVDITRIVCHDRPDARAIEGVVYLTASDRDLIESKVIALFSRFTVEARDLVDLFLFGDWLTPDSAARLRKKLKQASVSTARVADRLRLIETGRASYIRAIQMVLDSQLEPSACAHIDAAGGAAVVFDKVFESIRQTLKLTLGAKSGSKTGKRGRQ